MTAQDGRDAEQSRRLEAFLRDLRALRERQGLSIADLAQRTHFPARAIEAAESGPGRPALPVVGAYVRACRQEPDAWEDRWQALPADFTLIHLGHRGGRRPFGKLALAAGIVAVAAGGSALLVLRPAGHEAAPAVRRPVTARPSASVPAPATPPASPPAAPARTPSQARTANPAQTPNPAGTPQSARPPGPGGPAAPAPPPGPARPGATGPQVTGFGCPHGANDGVIVNSAATGPGWAVTDAGWTGNGCDGLSIWTMNPNGNQPVSSTLTWVFAPPAKATSCTVAVYVPTQNTLGLADYAISEGLANVATVTVDQAATAGQWVTLGRYQVNGPSLSIRVSPDPTTLTASGQGGGHNEAIAASAASATCG